MMQRTTTGIGYAGSMCRVVRSVLVPVLMMCLATGQLNAASDSDLDFGFIANPPGSLISIDKFRLHADCQGSPGVTVLFEAGLGGSAFEWQAVQRQIASRAYACVYDRAGYAWSDPAPTPRDARQLAREADALLTGLAVDGPVILVAHSFGGFIARRLAQLRAGTVIGMVLVDSSHEDQIDRMEAAGAVAAMPRGNNFIISAMDIADNLPDDIRPKVQAFARMRRTYTAIHAEMSRFRQSADQTRRDRKPVRFPIVVLRRGTDVYPTGAEGVAKNAIWKMLQEDLATISSRGKVVVAERSGHHIHVDQPDLVAGVIEELLDEYESTPR